MQHALEEMAPPPSRTRTVATQTDQDHHQLILLKSTVSVATQTSDGPAESVAAHPANHMQNENALSLAIDTYNVCPTAQLLSNHGSITNLDHRW